MDKDGLFVDFLMKKFFLFNIKVNCLSTYLAVEKLFFRQEINCDVVSFIRTKSSIKMENIFSKWIPSQMKLARNSHYFSPGWGEF